MISPEINNIIVGGTQVITKVLFLNELIWPEIKYDRLVDIYLNGQRVYYGALTNVEESIYNISSLGINTYVDSLGGDDYLIHVDTPTIALSQTKTITKDSSNSYYRIDFITDITNLMNFDDDYYVVFSQYLSTLIYPLSNWRPTDSRKYQISNVGDYPVKFDYTNTNYVTVTANGKSKQYPWTKFCSADSKRIELDIFRA